MKHWQQLSLEERRDLLNISSARTRLPADVIEKDWWVTATLYALIFNKIDYMDYGTHKRETVSFIPPNSILAEWEKDYESLKSIFIYDANPLSFPDLISRMNELLSRIREIK